MSAAQQRPKILIVDDEVGIRELLMEILTDEGYAVVVAENAEVAWELRLKEKLSLILLDIWMPGKDGLTLLKQWTDAGLLGVPIIVMSGHATIDTTVEAMKLGATEVLEKPIATNRLLIALQKTIYRGEFEAGSPEIQRINFGKSSIMQQFKKELLAASAESRPTLMVGIPMAGAGFFARMLAPPQGPIVYVDRNTQLEGPTDKILRPANGGLVIVRNIDQLTSIQQNGLLALTREAPKADARVVASTSKEPEALAEQGFNKNLLAAFSRHIVRQPSLTQYADDIPYVIDIITRQLTTNNGMLGRYLAPPAINLLVGRHYENDFLELLSLVRGALIHSTTEQVDAPTMRITLEQFLPALSSQMDDLGNIFTMQLREARIIFEQEYFRRLMNLTQGNISQAAQISGLERTYLYRKLKQYKE
ncbi:MAG: sigma-54-dependent transcriptional regulator [Gammaproteobacteria bacterium WSBS_2016_MAG_OTU1]